MKRDTASREILRTTSLVGLAAFGLHQLRYLIGYGNGADRALTSQGHSYMAGLLPELIGAAVLIAAATLVAAALSPARRRITSRSRAWVDWLICSLSLVAIFTAQELVEGFVASGHPGGTAALFAAAGWVALPLAFALGALVVAALSLLRRAERGVAGRLTAAVKRRRATGVAPLHTPPCPPAATPKPLAFGIACRPPPAAS